MPDKDNGISISQALGYGFDVSLIGVPINMAFPLETENRLLNRASGDFKLAMISAYKIGAYCKRLSTPAMMLVRGDGKPVDDECGKEGETVWNVYRHDNALILQPMFGEPIEILDEYETQAFKGGVALENPRISNGKACVDLHVWVKWKEWGGCIVCFDERIPICVALEGCHTVWDIGVARVEVCVKAASQLCAKLCVGKYGIEKCWDTCVDIPITAAVSATT